MKTVKTVRLLSRVMSVLKSFTPQAPELSAAEISRKAGLPKTTTHRILASLTESGLLIRNAGKYTIGPALYALGSLYLDTTDIFKVAGPVIKTLNELTGETVNLTVRQNGNIMLVMKEESRHFFRFAPHIGSIFPAHAAASGKALLSELDEAELDSLYSDEGLPQMTAKTIATKTELKLELKQIRSTNISVDMEGLFEGIEGVASVIRDASGKAVVAICISALIFRLKGGIRGRLAELVRLGCGLASYQLGYQEGDNLVRNIEEIRSWWEQDQSDSASQGDQGNRNSVISCKKG